MLDSPKIKLLKSPNKVCKLGPIAAHLSLHSIRESTVGRKNGIREHLSLGPLLVGGINANQMIQNLFDPNLCSYHTCMYPHLCLSHGGGLFSLSVSLPFTFFCSQSICIMVVISPPVFSGR